MFSFPPILDGNAGIKFTNNADSGFPKPGIREIFYSIKDGNWSDITVWETASGRVGLYPTSNDDVYIRHNINVDPFQMFLIGRTISVNNFIVTPSGRISGGPASGYGVVVFQDFKCYGNFAFTGNDGIQLNGLDNYIDKSRQETKINVSYVRNGDQPIMDATYATLTIPTGRSGLKYTTSDLTVDTLNSGVSIGTNTLYVKNPHSFTCNGAFTGWYFYSDTEYNLTFKGTVSSVYMFFCTRNPTIEFQNNISLSQGNYSVTGFIAPFPYGPNASIYLGTGLVKFTTNNILINNTGNIVYDNTFLIDNNIVVTTNVTNATMGLMNTINGSNASSQLINRGIINFGTQNSAENSMTVGIFDRTTNANTVGYFGNYSCTIPSRFPTFSNLRIIGTGIKTLGANTTINSNLQINTLNNTNGTLECSTFNLTVNGTTTIGGSSVQNGLLSKNGAGNVLFIGAVNSSVDGTGQKGINFTGNPTVEFRNGLSFYTQGAGNSINLGNNVSFTTNNQSINMQGGSVSTINNILISGAITLTISTGTLTVNNINGNNASSTLINTANLYVNSTSSNPLMATGILDLTTNINTVRYISTSNHNIPNYSYYHLEIFGGNTATNVKSLIANLSTLGRLVVTSCTLECSTYNVIVNGITYIGATISGGNGLLSKNGAGSLLFKGLFTVDTNTGKGLDLTGNPTVECQGGFISYVIPGIINTGTGTWTFSTNSQTFTNSSNTPITFNNNILISGAITVTGSSFGGTTLATINGTLNGDNVGSTFRMGTGTPILTYNNATQPMATGVLDTSTNLNTFIYGAGNQQVKGNPTAGQFQQYRNLRFSGAATIKTLQGNINVQNTYTVDTGVVVNLNGFTKTP